MEEDQILCIHSVLSSLLNRELEVSNASPFLRLFHAHPQNYILHPPLFSYPMMSLICSAIPLTCLTIPWYLISSIEK